ncbi:helix-turn-helix domain-containing protein [Geminocystis sp.]|uniref:helix-turn-helix domain-containing protein n=1 Tax=Geminocystis sp. TaxID=2664100 RepID=UPI0035933C2D
MNKEHFSLTTEIDNLDDLPIETLINIQRLYEDNNLPDHIKFFLEKEGFNSEKLSELMSKYISNSKSSKINEKYNHKAHENQIYKVDEEITYEDKTFIYDEEKMANGMPIYTGYKAMVEKDAWIEETISNLAVYRYEGKSNAENYIKHYINKGNTKEIITLPFSEAIQIIDKFGIDTAKLHLILAVHACRQEKPWDSKFTIKGSDLITALGWHKRTDLTITEKLKKISQLAWAINCLLIQVKWIYGKSKKNKNVNQIAIETSRIWDISVKEVGKENPLTEKVDNPEEIEITVRPGLWTYSFLNEGGQIAQNALYHFSWLSESIMSIDPYHEEAALRIAMIQSIAAYRDSYITVETWLKENLNGAGTRIEKAKNCKVTRSQLKTYWDNILNTLKNVGFTVNFDPETYPEWLRPDSQAKNKRGYFDILLQARVSITPPTPTYLRERKTNPKLIQKTITGTDIKKARESAGLSLAKVADYLKIHRSTLSKKESGDRILKQDEAKEILKVISILQDS